MLVGGLATVFSMDARQDHPLTRLLMDAAAGRFPPSDGTVAVLPSPAGYIARHPPGY